MAALAIVVCRADGAASELALLPDTVGVTDAITSDSRTGLALEGYDPTLYLIEGRAGLGDAAFEAVWGGLAWRFASAANRAAFLRDPENFLPRFGGHDPEAVARGLLVRSDPRLWARRAGRIYLFRTGDAKRRFEADDEAAGRAEERWPILQATLVQG